MKKFIHLLLLACIPYSYGIVWATFLKQADNLLEKHWKHGWLWLIPVAILAGYSIEAVCSKIKKFLGL